MKDPYVYDDSDILVNKVNIKDKKILDEFENRMSNLALVGLIRTNIEIKSTTNIFHIHKLLFENVYEWAGKPRTIDIYKDEPILNGLSVEYTPYKQILEVLNKIDKEYLLTKWQSLNKTDFIHMFTRMIANIWKVHPFREGNTRTIAAFAFSFLKQQGYQYNAELIAQHAKYFRNALVMASLGEYAEYQYLQNIFTDAISNKTIDKSNSKYFKIKDYEVNQYKYKYHKIKK